ncbi:conserved Plasmodium protein, unknown function [Plasmodium sp. DRC-Itaito]|nr:conserved Plasmodium protein, unknown function [Plasmodium sp. DRC-Itaito]
MDKGNIGFNNSVNDKKNILLNGGNEVSKNLSYLNSNVNTNLNLSQNINMLNENNKKTLLPQININTVNNTQNKSQEELKNSLFNNELQNISQSENMTFENKLNFNSSLKIRKSLTEQLCEEISMKLGKIFLCKSYLETFIYEKNPYVMNFIYLKDDKSESKNRVMNSLLLGSFCNLLWNDNIYTHEYLISKEILSKYIKALEKNPDKNNYCIVPIYDMDKIKMILCDQEKHIKILKKKKLTIKKNNENLLFILNIIKNNFQEIKIKAQRIIQRILFRLDILDKLFILKNNSVFFSNKYEYNKIKLMEMLDFFNSFNIDNQLQKINQNITDIIKEKKNLQKFKYYDNEYTTSLKNVLEKNEEDITQLKSTTSEICMNLEENKEFLYHLNAFEGEGNFDIM